MTSGATYEGWSSVFFLDLHSKGVPKMAMIFQRVCPKMPKTAQTRSKRPKKRDFFIKTEITPCTCEHSGKSSVFWICETLSVQKKHLFSGWTLISKEIFQKWPYEDGGGIEFDQLTYMGQKKLRHPPIDAVATPTQNCVCRFIGKEYGFWNPWTERPAKNNTFRMKWIV